MKAVLINIALLLLIMIIPLSAEEATTDSLKFNHDIVIGAEQIIGLEFSETERDSLLLDLEDQLKYYEMLRTLSIDNSVTPSIIFNPLPTGFKPDQNQEEIKWSNVLCYA